MSLSNIKINNNQVVIVDDNPITGSENLVKSGGVYNFIKDLSLNTNIFTYYLYDLKNICKNRSYYEVVNGELVFHEYAESTTYYSDFIPVENILYLFSNATNIQPSIMYFSIQNDNSFISAEYYDKVYTENHYWGYINREPIIPANAKYCRLQVNLHPSLLLEIEFNVLSVALTNSINKRIDSEIFSNLNIKEKNTLSTICTNRSYIEVVYDKVVIHNDPYSTTYYSDFIPIEYINELHSNATSVQPSIMYFADVDFNSFISAEYYDEIYKYNSWGYIDREPIIPDKARYCIIQCNFNPLLKRLKDFVLTSNKAANNLIGEKIGNINTYCCKAISDIFSTQTIYERHGTGMIYNMQLIGPTPHALQLFPNFASMKINVYTDGKCYFSGKIFELCGMGLNIGGYELYNGKTFYTPLFSKLGAYSGIMLNYKIPYYQSVSVELEVTEQSDNMMRWIVVKDSDRIDINYGGYKIPYGAYLYSVNNHVTASKGQEVELINTDKNGFVLSEMVSIDGNNDTTLEGCMRTYIKINNTPVFISSGMEDYFGFCHYFDAGLIQTPMMGCLAHDTTNGMKFCGYRNHIDDPIIFESGGFRMTLRNGDSNTGSSTVVGEPGNVDFNNQSTYYLWD